MTRIKELVQLYATTRAVYRPLFIWIMNSPAASFLLSIWAASIIGNDLISLFGQASNELTTVHALKIFAESRVQLTGYLDRSNLFSFILTKEVSMEQKHGVLFHLGKSLYHRIVGRQSLRRLLIITFYRCFKRLDSIDSNIHDN